MSKLVVLCTLLMSAVPPAGAQEAIRPRVAAEFGQPVTVQAEFVAKSETYYAQNLVPEPYALKVIAVNGRSLKEPVLIEYKLQAGEKQRTKVERVGEVMTFEAYESVYQPAFANPWLGAGEQGMSFTLIHVLYVRPPDTKSPTKR